MPVPIRYRGRSSGNCGAVWPTTVIHDVDWLPDAEAADGVGLESDRDGRLHALGPQARMHAALDDAELRLSRVGHDDLGRRRRVVA